MHSLDHCVFFGKMLNQFLRMDNQGIMYLEIRCDKNHFKHQLTHKYVQHQVLR